MIGGYQQPIFPCPTILPILLSRLPFLSAVSVSLREAFLLSRWSDCRNWLKCYFPLSSVFCTRKVDSLVERLSPIQKGCPS